MPNMLISILWASCSIVSLHALPLVAAPFNNCPTQAFLIQTPGATPIAFGVDLATGSYSTLAADMGTTKVNGVGFSYHDNYMYGWDYGAQTLAQIDDEFQTTALNVSGLIGRHFFVGDVAVSDNAWYGYLRKSGLYRIDLSDPGAALVMTKVADSSVMNDISITDFAFHPSDGRIYTVDNNGYLYRINASNGTTTLLTQVLSESELNFNFTFGAQYFDVDGNLYLSNNGNGNIYRISLDGEHSSAVFYAYGPSSNSNDGARCALAAIEVSDAVDFGDAPNSYGTSLVTSGARHSITTLYLGSNVDAEADAYAYPLSDDSSDANQDDDGISFPTGFAVGETSLILANVHGNNGYLNAWADWDLDGQFNSDEQFISQQAVNAGTNTINVSVPTWAIAGDSWLRFRISSIADIGPVGGVRDGEVEDYPIAITEEGVSLNYYPDAASYTTFAYEDLFPEQGDFDMNDVLMNVRITEYHKDDHIIRLKIEGKLAALGASYRNGFALQLPGINSNQVKADSISLHIDNVMQTQSILETNQTNAVLVVAENLWDIVQAGEGGCHFFRTEDGCGSSHRPSWTLVVPFASPISTASMPELPYDPFIFAKPGSYHGDLVDTATGIHPGRKFEVHLKNKSPTDSFESALFGLADDASEPNQQHFFQTNNGLPWALEIPYDWQHPKEKTSILLAYPQFFEFAADSTGNTNPDWYLQENANQNYIFAD